MKGRPFPDLELLNLERVKRGWTIERLAEESGISYTTCSRLVMGRSVSLEAIEKVAAAFLRNPPTSALAALLSQSA